MDDFIKQFESRIKRNDLIIDLGSGSGAFSKKFASLGARVVAVDQKPGGDAMEGVSRIESTVEDWITTMPADFSADACFLKNVVQYFGEEYVFAILLPALKMHTATGGCVAIETFTKLPVPPFDTHMTTFSADALTSRFEDWNIIFRSERKQEGKDMKGKMRTFYLTQVIAQRQ